MGHGKSTDKAGAGNDCAYVMVDQLNKLLHKCKDNISTKKDRKNV